MTNADFTPNIPDSDIKPTTFPYTPTGSFRFWAQKVLPTVYDDSLSYYEILTKVANYLNNLIKNVDSLNGDIGSIDTSFSDLQNFVNNSKNELIEAYELLQGYVNTYFDDLDVQDEIDQKLDEMAEDGTLAELMYAEPYLFIPYLNGEAEPCGNCFVYIYKRKCTIIDLGYYPTFEGVKEQLESLGVTTIDNIIITHWHHDHDGFQPNYTGNLENAYDHWKEAFDMENTVFYIPRNTPTGFTGSGAYYAISASFANNEINILNNDTEFEWHNVTFSVKNQSDDDYDYYASLDTRDYNNCSAVVTAKYKTCVFIDTSDINRPAQQRCTENGYIQKATIASVPHHGVNGSCYQGLMATIRPAYAYIANSNRGLQYGMQDPTIGILWVFATIFENAFNTEGITFGFNNGVTISGSPTATTGRGLQGVRQIYVDESVNIESYQDGTAEHPYRSITTACGYCKGYTEIILLSDITTTMYLSGQNGVVKVSGNDHQIGGVNASDNILLILNNIKTYANYGIYLNDSQLFISDSVINSGINAQRSRVYAFRTTLNNSRFMRDCLDCYVTIATISGTTPDYLVSNASRTLFFITDNSVSGGINGSYNEIVNRSTPYDVLHDPFNPPELPTVTNLDNAPAGVCYVGSGVTNCPEDYSVILTLNAGNHIQQIAFPMASTPNKFYVRKNSGSGWVAWRTVSTDAIT